MLETETQAASTTVEPGQGRRLDGIAVRVWLVGLIALVGLMVMVGGTTRLTGSGLSMVEWRPLMGTLPPMSDDEWARVFAAYQLSPQYLKVNHWMSLSDFQSIFFWEYTHRLLGRLVGLVSGLPWLYFVLRGQLSTTTRRRSFLALLLGGAQGVLGWFMVKSGLADVPAVSHFFLAGHLCLAFGVGAWLTWTLVAIPPSNDTQARSEVRCTGLRRVLGLFSAALCMQIVYGAFMAGTRAGYLFQTFPDMNGQFGVNQWLTQSGLVYDLLNTPAVIHWAHRLLALVVLVSSYFVWSRIRRSAISNAHLATTWALATLGALTVVSGMSIGLAVSHQVGAYLLVLLTVTLWSRVGTSRV